MDDVGPYLKSLSCDLDPLVQTSFQVRVYRRWRAFGVHVEVHVTGLFKRGDLVGLHQLSDV